MIMEFPRLVYKSADEHRVASSQEEFNILRKDGWFDSVPEALRGEHEVAEVAEDINVPATRKELEAKAFELGMKFDGRIGDSKLSSMIDHLIRSKK